MLRHVLPFSQINDISSEDEEFEKEAEGDIILSTSKISSSHEVNNYISFELKDENNITFVHILLEALKLIDGISTSVAWHINKNCNILVDLNSLKSRQDITVDCWSWILSKTYILSSKNKDGPFRKGNFEKEFCLVKRIDKCNEPADLRKNIMTLLSTQKSNWPVRESI